MTARTAPILLLSLLLALLAAAPASAAPVLTQGWEGGLGSWAATGYWHVEDQPQTKAVIPAINPTLVTLPDAGGLPSAYQGSKVAWFGEAATGTFCGTDRPAQGAKNGCSSNGVKTGLLTSPSFSLAGATSAQLTFAAFWEIEAKNTDRYDLMKVEYSTDGGSVWTQAGLLNPTDNPAGKSDQNYSANGLNTAPSWNRYVVDLTAAAGKPDVKVRFSFDTRDSLYQGFRGLMVDDIAISTPFAQGAPRIDALVPDCVVSGQSTGQVVTIGGANFILGSKVLLDGSAAPKTATPSSTRMEILVANLAAGNHTIQIQTPNGSKSGVAQLRSATKCAAKHPTGTRVSCNRGPNPTDDFECTVEVGDGGFPPSNPAGTVTWSTTRGAYRYGSQCALKPTPHSGSVSFCEVTWVPPPGGLQAGNQPDVFASYPGDAEHLASAGGTQPKIALGFSVPPPGSADTCTQAATDAESVAKKQGAKASAASGRAQAHASLNTFHYDEKEESWGGWVYYNAATCKNTLHAAIGYVLQGAGVAFPVGANIAVYVDPEPASKTGLYIGTNLVVIPVSMLMYKAGESTVETAGKAQKDPPDRRYKVYAKVARTPKLIVRSGRALSRKGASALGALLTAQLRLAATAKALGATIDKAGGALVAKSRTWQGRQTRLALRYNRSLVRQLRALPGLRGKAARATRGSRIFSRPQSRRAVLRAQARVRRSGLPRGMVRYLRKLGFSRGELRKLRKVVARAKLGKDLRPATLLTERKVDDAYRIAAAYFRIWAASPQVIAASRLR